MEEEDYRLGPVQMVKIKDLSYHPKCIARFVPKDEEMEFNKNIRNNGIKDAIIADRKNRILNGRRRFTAARKAGLKEVPVQHLISDERPRVLRQILYGLNQLPKRFEVEEIAKILIEEYGEERLLQDNRGGNRKSGDFRAQLVTRLDVEVAKDFICSQGNARKWIALARSMVLEKQGGDPAKKLPADNELRERISGALKNYLKLQPKVEKIEQDLNEKKRLIRSYERTFKEYGGLDKVARELKIKLPKKK